MHLARGRRVLNELHDVILVDDFARRRRKIAANLKGRQIRLRDFEKIVRALHVFDKVFEPFDQITDIGCKCFRAAPRGWCREVCRRAGTCDLVEVEAGFVALALIQAFGLFKQCFCPIGREQVELFAEIEVRVVAPFRVLEAVVALGRFGQAASTSSPIMRRVMLAHRST